MNINQFMKLKPCYTREKIEEIAGDKKDWTALDILRIDNVPAKDRLWAVLREDFIPARTLHLFACIIAEKALREAKIRKTKNNPSWEAIRIKRLWIDGKVTDEELKAADAAAYAAARAADAAADAAACAAAYAARAAADFAAADAARAAACAAARESQVKLLVDLLQNPSTAKTI